MAFHFDRIHFPIHNDNDNEDLSTFLISYPPTVNIQGINWIQVHNKNDNDNDYNEDDDNIIISNIKNQNEKKKNVIDLTFSDDDDENDKNKNDNTNDKQVISKNKQNELNHHHKESSKDILLEFATLGDKRISASLKRKYKDRLIASARDYMGKWMIFPTSENVQDIWNEIATKVYNGELGCSAKVSNKDPPSTSNNSSSIGVSRWNEDNYLICVYVDDFRDEEDVRRVLRVLLRIKGVKINAGFKADFITDLGIYSDKKKNPKCFPNAHKLDFTLYKDMLKDEKYLLYTEQASNNSSNTVDKSSSSNESKQSYLLTKQSIEDSNSSTNNAKSDLL